MTVLPLRARGLRDGNLLVVSESGSFSRAELSFAERLANEALTPHDVDQLTAHGMYARSDDPLATMHHDYAIAQRLTRAGPLDYLILVPTLRCNLSCSYCQVSRAPEEARHFDWTEETLNALLDLIDGLDTDNLKVEFQGGEPTLRPDLIKAVIDRCARFTSAQFVICTNLHRIGDEQLRLFDDPRVFISTSLDGTLDAHARQRTANETPVFIQNLNAVIERYGSDKVSALPTIDSTNPPPPEEIIATFTSFGLNSIFLRPINYQGFARKQHPHAQSFDAAWPQYHRQFIRSLIDTNWHDRSRVLEETYFSICLRRIFQPGRDRHVDLRNPNPMGVDYIVVDYDGTIYPTDEARMLSRSRVVDLSLGMVGEDWKGDKWALLNQHATNQFDSDCLRCAYQPYCGRDVVDDLSRYGTIDIRRTKTAFCQRQMSLFDFAFELIYDESPDVRYSLARWLRLDGDPACFGSNLS